MSGVGAGLAKSQNLAGRAAAQQAGAAPVNFAGRWVNGLGSTMDLAIVGSADTIKTLWQMTTNVDDPNETTGLWASIFAGADTFTR